MYLKKLIKDNSRFLCVLLGLMLVSASDVCLKKYYPRGLFTYNFIVIMAHVLFIAWLWYYFVYEYPRMTKEDWKRVKKNEKTNRIRAWILLFVIVIMSIVLFLTDY